MHIKVLGSDLGKTICSLAGLDEAGAVFSSRGWNSLHNVIGLQLHQFINWGLLWDAN